MGNFHAVCYRLLPAMVRRMPNFAGYSYWSLTIVLGAYSMLRWLVHDYCTWKI